MNAKRILSLFLAAVLTLGVAVTPAVAASAAPALPGSAALEESNGPVHQADGLRPAGVRLSV